MSDRDWLKVTLCCWICGYIRPMLHSYRERYFSRLQQEPDLVTLQDGQKLFVWLRSLGGLNLSV